MKKTDKKKSLAGKSPAELQTELDAADALAAGTAARGGRTR